MVFDQYDDEALILARRFMKTARELAVISKFDIPDIVGQDLNVNQFRALQLLRHRPGLTQKDVAENLNIKPSSASVAIRRLEDLKFVERHADPEDGRVMRLYLGRRGQEIVHRTDEMQANFFADLLSTLPMDEQRMVINALERAISARKVLLETEGEQAERRG